MRLMCLFPVKARLAPDGGRPKVDHEGDLRLPCGHCSECITLRAVEWSIRAKHEMSCHLDNCFITLTYDDANLPSHLIVKDPFQRFLKRLRKSQKKKFSYIVSHEYGGRFYRPHHHCIIFGYTPKDQKFLKNSPSGERLYVSDEMKSLWPHGFHSIGTANEKTAFYIAAYALKGKKHPITLPDGSIEEVSDCFDCSKRPGIGLNFLKTHYKSLIHSGEPLPRYYRKKLEIIDPVYLQRYENDLILRSRPKSNDERLAKFVINDAKNSLSKSEFRVDTRDERVKKHLHEQIRQDIRLDKFYQDCPDGE